MRHRALRDVLTGDVDGAGRAGPSGVEGLISRQAIAKQSAAALVLSMRARASSTSAKPNDPSSLPTLEIDAFKRSQSLGRPVSPHLQIYQPQITWILSALNRVTGFAVGGIFYIGAMTYAVMPFSSSAVAATVASAPFMLNVLGKALIAVPTVFHSLNGIRHLIWDQASQLDLKGVYTTGWIVIGLTAVISAGLCAI
ncbi:hypothetical protein HK101_011378 [Irineochytrium annulatum]|nr:hypothetical protein HK101_011378 [Irineochytrium annulatum]